MPATLILINRIGYFRWANFNSLGAMKKIYLSLAEYTMTRGRKIDGV